MDSADGGVHTVQAAFLFTTVHLYFRYIITHKTFFLNNLTEVMCSRGFKLKTYCVYLEIF